MSERDLTSAEIETLVHLADLSERDPALYEQIIREGVVEAEQHERAEALLGMFENAAERRQEQDRALLDAIFRVEPEDGQE
jgi:alkylhydroperoxidase family enzyme